MVVESGGTTSTRGRSTGLRAGFALAVRYRTRPAINTGCARHLNTTTHAQFKSGLLTRSRQQSGCYCDRGLSFRTTVTRAGDVGRRRYISGPLSRRRTPEQARLRHLPAGTHVVEVRAIATARRASVIVTVVPRGNSRIAGLCPMPGPYPKNENPAETACGKRPSIPVSAGSGPTRERSSQTHEASIDRI